MATTFQPMISGLAQLALNIQLRVRPGSLLARAGARASRTLGLCARQTPVHYSIGPYRIALPIAHALPIHQQSFPLYDTGLGRLVALVAAKYPQSSIVDIGANVGDTAAAIRCATRIPLICIEGNPEFVSFLDSNVAQIDPTIIVEHTMVGVASGRARGRLESNHGTARIVPSSNDSIVFATLSEVLARHGDLPGPQLVKIDTDGYDIPILLSSPDVLRRTKPVVFFEFCPDYYEEAEVTQMWELLAEVGYTHAVVLRNTGEYSEEIDIRSNAALRDVRLRYFGFRNLRYADIALFSDTDLDIASAFREGEARATLAWRRASP